MFYSLFVLLINTKYPSLFWWMSSLFYLILCTWSVKVFLYKKKNNNDNKITKKGILVAAIQPQ